MLRLLSCHPQRSTGLEADRDYERVDFSIHSPTYSVKYLGFERLFKAGLSEICDTVKTVYVSQKPALKSLNHFSLKLTKQELTLRDKDSTEDEEKVFALRRILFCGVVKTNQKIFFYNYQFGQKGDAIDCHAVLCENKLEAKSLAKVISKAFKEAQHEEHQMDIASRRLHAQNLSESSISHLHVDGLSNIEANRQYYNFSFKNSRSNSAASSSYFRSNSRTPEVVKRSNHSCHLGASIEWERTESSLDNAGHSDSADVEKTSTSGDEVFGCSCRKESLPKGKTHELATKETAQGRNESNAAAEMNQELSQSALNDGEQIVTENIVGWESQVEYDWSKVFSLEETAI